MIVVVAVGLLISIGPLVVLAVAIVSQEAESDAIDDQANGDEASESDGEGTTTIPPPAAVNECVQVTSSGGVAGTLSCSEGGAPYRVLEVFDGPATCEDPDNSVAVSGTWSLCVEVNLVENYCYSIPDFGWITPSECELPGTVSVVDVVPGGTSDAGCTQEFQWNRYYTFESPVMVACVMAYD